MVDPPCAEFEALDNFDGVRQVLVSDLGVVPLGAECLLGWYLLLVYLLQSIHVRVWIHNFPQNLRQICCCQEVELLVDADITLQSCFLQVLGEGGQA